MQPITTLSAAASTTNLTLAKPGSSCQVSLSASPSGRLIWRGGRKTADADQRPG